MIPLFRFSFTNPIVKFCITTEVLSGSRASWIQRKSALSTLLLRYSIAATYLHNASNDASYTFRIMIAIVLDVSHNKKTAEDLKIEKRRLKRHTRRQKQKYVLSLRAEVHLRTKISQTLPPYPQSRTNSRKRKRLGFLKDHSDPMQSRSRSARTHIDEIDKYILLT